jgi:chemotaxis protein MotA
MYISTLFDPASAAIVVGGTLLATVLQCGAGDCRAALAAVNRLRKRGFEPAQARAELLGHVRDICQDGVVRAHSPHLGDPEIDEATGALIGRRSVEALLEAHESHRARRLDMTDSAQQTLTYAAELAPTFGLAGTLLALTRLAGSSAGDNLLASAVGMAVLTTLYGLLLAHLVLAPLARAVERAGAREERDRQEVIDWLASQLAAAIPRGRPGRPRAVA